MAGRLEANARARPDAVAVILLGDGGAPSGLLTFAELEARSVEFAARLTAEGLAGTTALLPAEASLDFVVALCGCLRAGVVAALAPAARRGVGLERLRRVAEASGARAVLTDLPELELAAAPVLGIDGAPEHSWAPPPPGISAPAILQFTSGSSGPPQGVLLSHANLAANLDMLIAAFGAHADSRILSWLPTFHDMGLMSLLAALHGGFTCILAPPTRFLQRPARWLQAVSEHRATISGAPNFAYDLCNRRVAPELFAGLDLSAWEVAFCGAEPVRAATLARFAERARPAGFNPAALFPCYGLAEATVYVSGGPRGRGVRTREIDGRPVVSCGPPAPGSRVEIVDPDTLAPLMPGGVGEIWVAGPHVAAPFAASPEEAARFGAPLAGRSEAWLRSGDLGVLIDGELHIVGRRRDIIIHRGVNHAAEDIEASVFGSSPLYQLAVAAFAVALDGEERVVAVQELPRRAPLENNRQALVDAARAAVARDHGLRLHELVLTAPGALPRTSSGKVSRARARSLHLAGELARRSD